MPEVHLTVKQYAACLQSGQPSVLSLIRSGALRAIDISPGKKRRTWRIPADAIIEFESRQAATKPKKPAKRARRRKKQSGTDFVKYF